MVDAACRWARGRRTARARPNDRKMRYAALLTFHSQPSDNHLKHNSRVVVGQVVVMGGDKF